MNHFEKQLMIRIHDYTKHNGRRPAAILAWNDAYARIRSDWQNVVVYRDRKTLVWKGCEVLRVDAPGDNVHLLDGLDNCLYED